MKVGFIGLGNVGGKLANSLLRNKFDLTVIDLDSSLTKNFAAKGASTIDSPKELAQKVDLIITCLPSPKICAEIMEKKDGVIEGLSKNKIWIEMSTTDNKEVKRIGDLVKSKGAIPLDAPVSGGCHRAATGNIAIFVGGERKSFVKEESKSITVKSNLLRSKLLANFPPTFPKPIKPTFIFTSNHFFSNIVEIVDKSPSLST